MSRPSRSSAVTTRMSPVRITSIRPYLRRGRQVVGAATSSDRVYPRACGEIRVWTSARAEGGQAAVAADREMEVASSACKLWSQFRQPRNQLRLQFF